MKTKSRTLISTKKATKSASVKAPAPAPAPAPPTFDASCFLHQALMHWTDRVLGIYEAQGVSISEHYAFSWVRIWMTFVCPDWVNNLEEELPLDNLSELFYLQPSTSTSTSTPPWVFDTFAESPEKVFTEWGPILENSLVRCHLDIAQRMGEDQSFFHTGGLDARQACQEELIQFTSFLTIGDRPSWTYREAQPYREASMATWCVMRAIRSIALLPKDPEQALALVGLPSIDAYVRHVMIPFIGASMVLHRCDVTNSLVELDDRMVTHWYQIPTQPKPEWSPSPSQEYLDWCEKDRRQQWVKLGMGRGVLNSLNCSTPPPPSSLGSPCPPDETPRSMHRPHPQRPSPGPGRGSAPGRGHGPVPGQGRGRGGRGPPPDEPLPRYAEGTTRIPPLEILKKIPMIMRRRDARPSTEGAIPCFFQDSVYALPGGAKTIVDELPALLQNPVLRDAFMQSAFRVFERPIHDMPVFYRKQLCEVVTSLCLELQPSTLSFEERHAIIQKYHGVQRDDESLEQYYFNFRANAWDAIADLHQSLNGMMR